MSDSKHVIVRAAEMQRDDTETSIGVFARHTVDERPYSVWHFFTIAKPYDDIPCVVEHALTWGYDETDAEIHADHYDYNTFDTHAEGYAHAKSIADALTFDDVDIKEWMDLS
ncbi:hypothetical protein [Aeromicrobium sp. 179-A 4D2 NHS]|uniref:hypothetical protein n=1 Tax=Aeromicrobium sp. 179-A 4D2 NHS TaxID=3142375 RepID=UPI0039A312C3